MSHTYTPAPSNEQAPTAKQATAQAPSQANTTTTAPNCTISKEPAHASSTAQPPKTAPAARGSTRVTLKWLMPLDIRPSHTLPLCACVTPMHQLHYVVGSNHITCSC
ncbi:hypothetical protein O181_069510 [Austropuccinia psidii MF-1]|uniref:Uncharacterized protein n=1 Tax=Austropuccinia psidii MF-1 TaxID=1389203 RepID=A0A9Q3I858_9BASI|nr:hypothetical protein [Austropuccinia psidii MF-1]